MLPLRDDNPTRRAPVVTVLLILVNVAVYFLVQPSSEDPTAAEFSYERAAIPCEVVTGEPLSLTEIRSGLNGVDVCQREDTEPPVFPSKSVLLAVLTSMFLHGSLLHLAGNMLYLWIFGDNVEEVLGTLRYLVVYLACGLVGTLAQIAAAPDSKIPTLGASGAIAGVMGAYVVWFPHNRVRVLVFRFITEMPALLVIGGWIAIQVWESFGSAETIGKTGGVAYLAHVGGAVAGIAAAFLFQDRARAVHDVDTHIGWARRY